MQRVSKGIRARRVAAPPPPLRAEMGGSTSSEKRDFDGVACWRGGSPSKIHNFSGFHAVAQADDKRLARVIATSDKIALRVPLSPVHYFSDAYVYSFVFLAH